MSSWRELTEDDVLRTLVGAEFEAYRRVQAEADGSDGDVLPAMMETAVMEARGRIAACKRNVLAEGLTVPEAVVHHIVAIIRYRLLSRLGVRAKPERDQEYKDARSFLQDVAKCLVAIPSPAGADDTQQHWPKPSIKAGAQHFGRAAQDGI